MSVTDAEEHRNRADDVAVTSLATKKRKNLELSLESVGRKMGGTSAKQRA